MHSIAIVSGKLHEWKIPERDVKQFLDEKRTAQTFPEQCLEALKPY
jgi:hypothetical protein